jgi:Probable zinc-ribbon domain
VYQDKTRTCSECSRPFIYTAAEQEFYAGVGFAEGPSRCPTCRGVDEPDSSGGLANGFVRDYAESTEEQLFAAACVRCGAMTRVPARMVFGDGTIYCADCIRDEYGNPALPPEASRGTW